MSVIDEASLDAFRDVAWRLTGLIRVRPPTMGEADPEPLALDRVRIPQRSPGHGQLERLTAIPAPFDGRGRRQGRQPLRRRGHERRCALMLVID